MSENAQKKNAEVADETPRRIESLPKGLAEQIAELAGCHWRTVYRWNAGRRVWREREILEAIETLNISTNGNQD